MGFIDWVLFALILIVVFLPPVGTVFLWKKEIWSSKIRWGITFLLFGLFWGVPFLIISNNQNNDSSISDPISCLTGVDWVYPSASNPTGAWKFSSDGTFNSSTTMFGGMSTWGNWADLGGGRIKITYTRTTENYLPDSQIIELNGCNELSVGQTLYIKD